MRLAPTLWSSVTTYFEGSIVSDQTGQLWVSKTPNNLGNDPTQTLAWEQYFGPLTVMKYDSSTAYFAGELVYTAPGDGSYNVFASKQSSNAVDPSLPNQWSVTTTYFQNQVVQVFPDWAVGTTYTQGQTVLYTDGNVYSSLTNGNLGNIPAPGSSSWALAPVLTLTTQPVPATGLTSPPLRSPVIEWAATTTYSAGAFVLFNSVEYLSVLNNNAGNYPNVVGSTFWEAVTGGTFYMSLVDLNTANPPVSSPLQWTTTFTQGGGNQMWTQIGGAAFPMGVALLTLNIIYPLGTGPVSQSNTRNIYRLPSGYLRQAPRDPKAGSASYLGAPTNLQYTDWNLESNYIVTHDTDPIMFRFVADLPTCGKWALCSWEYLAASIACECCTRITQSTDQTESPDQRLQTMGRRGQDSKTALKPGQPSRRSMITSRRGSRWEPRLISNTHSLAAKSPSRCKTGSIIRSIALG